MSLKANITAKNITYTLKLRITLLTNAIYSQNNLPLFNTV